MLTFLKTPKRQMIAFVVVSLVSLTFYKSYHPLNFEDIQNQTVLIQVEEQADKTDLSDSAKSKDAKPKVKEGLGSGFFIDPRGFIVTNNHVVGDASSITVITRNGVAAKAKLVGTDPDADIAVIKIDQFQKFSVSTWGNSDDVKVGDTVIAVGNPFGLEWTVTKGIMSNVTRSLTPFYTGFQDDASVNPGNSGGPLFNEHGEVIAVNNAIASKVGQNAGISFAIPSNYAKMIATRIMNGESIVKSSIQIGIDDNSMTKNDIDYPDHIIIKEVISGGSGDKAGLKVNDIIVSVDGIEVNNTTEAIEIIANKFVGSTIHLKIMRDGNPMNIDVVTVARAKQQ